MNKKILILFLFLTVILAGCSGISSLIPSSTKPLKTEDAQAKAEKYINENLLADGVTAKIDGISEENGLYKLAVTLSSGQKVDSYMTQDGTKFFTQAYEMNPPEATPTDENTNTNQPPAEVTKSDKPVVEAFVMSYCPYGTQIEKGLLPVADTLKDKIDLQIKFCDYAMHGEKELTENLTQFCIGKNEPGKFNAYLKCFLKASDSPSCVKEAGIDNGKLTSCMADTDKEFKVTEQFKDKSKWISGQFPPFDVHKADNQKYNVQGSPTLIINGAEASAGRDSASLLAAICAAFNTPPEECKTQLSSQAPSSGFGFDTTAASGNTAASCGN